MRTLLIVILGLFLINGCSSSDNKDANSVETAFKEAKEYEDDERYEEALRRYDEIKNKYPYSQYSKEADLRVSDIYFKREEFSSAALAYANFKYLYPNHPQMPYISLQLALSYFHQMPESIDRDLSKGHNAIQEFNLVIEKYPGTEYAKTAQEKKLKAQDMLAEKELYIADFYFKREKYLSALGRYEAILKMPSPSSVTSKAYRKAAISALEIGEHSRGQKYLELLTQKFPTSEDSSDVADIKKKYGLR